MCQYIYILSSHISETFVFSLDEQMADIHKVYLSSLLLAYLFQFKNPTLLSSPLLSLQIGSVLARYFQVELAVEVTYSRRRSCR